MDKFKELQNKVIGGWGGIHCPCCNDFKIKKGNKHNVKATLNRIVRHILKNELKKEINDETE